MGLSVKEIKKLATLCRKQGIQHFRCADFEFTLTDVQSPLKSMALPKFKKLEADNTPMIASENDLSDEELLFYSSGQGF